MNKIMLVEDEPQIQSVVKKYLTQAEFEVITADDGFEALEKFDSSIDLICLDLMMPNIDGWTVCETIRETSNVPIIIMTALSSEEDQLKGYSYNIDDYITKPFNPKILVAKIKSVLARYTAENKSTTPKVSENILNAGNISLDTNKMLLKIDGKTKYISKTEFDLLTYFLKNEGEILTREQILDNVWAGDTLVDTRIVDAYIKKLRKLLDPYSKYIKTIFGVGYRFIVE